jgi:DNA-binding transcriptional LysR family regulator
MIFSRMRKEPIETLELLAFVKTVNAGSLSGAAAVLGAPRATITRRVAQLEKRLSTRLLRRTTRSLALTDAGEQLYLHAQIALDAIQNAEASVQRTDDAIRGDLRVSMPPLHNTGFNTMLCEFAKQHPALRVHVHFSSGLVDLQRGGFDAAIRASSKLEPGLIARTLTRNLIIAVCTPGYLKARGEPTSRRDLRKHSCLMSFAHGELRQTHWPTKNKGKLYVEGSFFASDVQLLVEAAVSGMGIAMLPTPLVEPLIERGLLVRVLPNILEAESQIAVVYPEREFVPPQVKAFVDAVVAWRPTALGNRMTQKRKEAPQQKTKR